MREYQVLTKNSALCSSSTKTEEMTSLQALVKYNIQALLMCSEYWWYCDAFNTAVPLTECTNEQRCDPNFVVRKCKKWWNLRKSDSSIWR